MLLIWVGYQYGIDVYTVCLILGVYEHWYDVFIAHHTWKKCHGDLQKSVALMTRVPYEVSGR